MSVVADTLTAGTPDQTAHAVCHCADVSALKPQEINTLLQKKKKLHIFS